MFQLEDAILALSNPDGRWSLDLVGKNLTNRTIIISPAISTSFTNGPRKRWLCNSGIALLA